MRGTTIFLAGGEVETLTNALVDNGVRWILYSFYYMWEFNKFDFIERMQDKHPEITWFLDSGAFTYSVQAKKKPLPSPQAYARLYFEFIQRQGHRWHRIAELDLDGIEGLNISEGQVEDWTNEMLTSWPDLPIMPCWHGWRGWQAWERYLKDPRIRHLAFGRASMNDRVRRKMCLTARSVNKTVHGFGFTKLKTSLNLVPCDSVDSTSWVLGQKFGTLYVFQGDKLHVLDSEKKDQRRRFRRYFEGIGCDPKLIEADDVAELRKANVIAWRNVAERFQSLKERRDHVVPLLQGLTPDERFLSRDELPPNTERALGRVPGVTERATAPLERETSLPSKVPLERTTSEPSPRRGMLRPLAGFGVPNDAFIGAAHPRRKEPRER
jgi:hypothetical protein